jgi:ELWxxDGT repeat protein
LWSIRSTGSDNQTTLLATIGLGNRYGYYSDAPKITFVAKLPNGKWLFTANDGTHGRELWVTNGTAAGTLMLSDIYLGNSSGIATIFEYKVRGNLLYFAANDGISGEELWVTNGTAAATLKAKDFRTGSGGADIKLFGINGRLHVIANDGSGVKIWKKND